jgi:3-(3-hydroxy-phenyl)propionate hydroxylase
MASLPENTDVLIVGAGPTGLTLANLLGGMGMDTVLIERNTSTVQEPRAVSIDDESMRTMQAAGLADAVQDVTARGYGSIYRGPSGKQFAQVMPSSRDYGWDKRNAFEQPVLEAILREGLARHTSVQAHFGFEATGYDQRADEVAVTVANGSKTRQIRARFVVAADGGRSPARKALGIEMEGSSFAEPWLIVDLPKTNNHARDTEVFCDPARPCISLPGPNGIRRYEFMLMKGEDPTAMVREEKVRELLARVGPDRDMPMRRVQVYTFHARLATRWRDGRILLAGDAAHLTPPFAGQGMNSGLRDAYNLAWKLDEAARAEAAGLEPDALLDSYYAERKPHAWEMIKLALNMGRVMMPTSQLQGTLTRVGFRTLGLWPPARDYVAQMRYKPKPRFRAGLIWPATGKAGEVVGQMIPQPEIETIDRQRMQMDACLPDRPLALVLDATPAHALAKETRAALEAAGAEVIGLTPKGHNPIPGDFAVYRDASGLLSRGPFAALVGHVLLLRRDRYIAATEPIATAATLAAHINQLAPAGWGETGVRTKKARPA